MEKLRNWRRCWHSRSHSLEMAHVTGMSKISSSITKPGVYSSGTPFMENKIWLKNAALFKKLEKLLKKKYKRSIWKIKITYLRFEIITT